MDTGMFKILFILFLAIPVLEIYLLIKVGGLIGAMPTVLAVIGTAVLGAYLLRLQGISTLRRVQETLQRGELPAVEMFEGVILLIAGALLLTPGFFTDTLGFLALVPGLRRRFVVWLLEHGNIIVQMPGRPADEAPRGPRTIEGEYRRENDDR